MNIFYVEMFSYEISAEEISAMIMTYEYDYTLREDYYEKKLNVSVGMTHRKG